MDGNNTCVFSPSGSGVQGALSWDLCSEPPRLPATDPPETWGPLCTAVVGIPNLTAVELMGACFFTAQRRQVSLLLESSEDPESVSHPVSSALFPGQHPPFRLTQRQLIRDLDSICKIPLPLPCNGTHRQVPATRRRRR